MPKTVAQSVNTEYGRPGSVSKLPRRAYNIKAIRSIPELKQVGEGRLTSSPSPHNGGLLPLSFQLLSWSPVGG
jgi:hypothetical protein